MTTTTGATQARLTPDDLADLVTLLTACDLAVLGRIDFAEDEIEADLHAETVESYGWRDADGRLVGYGYLEKVAASDKVVIDAYVLPRHDPGLGPEILARLERRGTELVARDGHDTVLFDVGVYREDEQSQGWLAGRGYRSATSFVRMRIDLDELVHRPAVYGVTVRRTDKTDADLQAAYRVEAEAFLEHYAHVHLDFDAWHARLVARGEDFAELWLAEIDGEAVGLLVGTGRFVRDENAGYVRTLGTLPAARGKGVGTALLRAYFASEQGAGRSAVLLHVDVANVTGALAIYESVGMRPVVTIDAWAKRSAVTA